MVNGTHAYHGRTVAWLLAVLERRIRREPPDSGAFARLCPDDLGDLLAAQRLEPLFHACLPAEGLPAAWLPLADRCARAYQYNLMKGLNGLRQATEFIQRMAEGGVEVVAWRGPFTGVDVYDDVGARGFADIDLLIHGADRDRAWALVLGLGYRPCQALPRGVFDRHHLHWRLAHPDKASVVVELHWALDHPYKPYTIDYEAIFRDAASRRYESFAWRRPSPAHAWLMACIHLQKHMRLTPAAINHSDFMERVIRHGGLRYWLDMAMMVGKYGDDLNGASLSALAGTWAVADCMAIAVGGFARIWPDLLPETLRHGVAAGSAHPVRLCLPAVAEPSRRHWVAPLASWIGFRPVCLTDLVAYACGPDRRAGPGSPPSRPAFRRAPWSWYIGCLVLRLGLDAASCLIWVASRRFAKLRGKKHAA